MSPSHQPFSSNSLDFSAPEDAYNNLKLGYEGIFKIINVSCLIRTVGLKLNSMTVSSNSYTRKSGSREIPIRNAVLDDNVKSKEKRKNFKICTPISLSILIFFSNNFLSFPYFGDQAIAS